MSNAPAAAPPANVAPPRVIDFAGLALVLEGLAWLGAALALRTNTGAFLKLLYKSNDPKTKKPYVHNHANDVKLLSDLDASRRGLLVQAIVLCLAFVLLAYMLRRTRGASAARWSVVIVSVLIRAPLYLLSIGGGLPAPSVVANVAIGATSLVALVLMFVPASRAYFRQCREAIAAATPDRPARTGGLFGPRVPRLPAPKVNLDKQDPAAAKPAVQEKKRTDAAAIAKGAALARSRAKAAGKSRRMED